MAFKPATLTNNGTFFSNTWRQGKTYGVSVASQQIAPDSAYAAPYVPLKVQNAGTYFFSAAVDSGAKCSIYLYDIGIDKSVGTNNVLYASGTWEQAQSVYHEFAISTNTYVLFMVGLSSSYPTANVTFQVIPKCVSPEWSSTSGYVVTATRQGSYGSVYYRYNNPTDANWSTPFYIAPGTTAYAKTKISGFDDSAEAAITRTP